MTIAYVLDDTLDKSDGVQQAMITIAEKMRELGHEVHYIVPYTERSDLTNVHSVSKIVSFKFNGNSIRTPVFSSRKKIKLLLETVNFDVIHVQMPYSPIMAGKIIKLANPNTKIIGTFHILPYNWLASIGTKLLGLWLFRSKRRINQSLAVSKPAHDFMSDKFGLSGEVLPNPVDYKFYNSFKKLKKDNLKTRIVFVGRFEKRKGVTQLALAYSNIINRDNLELIMCGRGPLFSDVNKFSEKNKLGIIFPGFVSEVDKAKYLASADIAVFPSISGESFGIVLSEAMSAGASIVLAGNNPGYASVMESWPEVLFDSRNIQEFTSILEKYIFDIESRKRIGGLQQNFVKSFDIDNVVSRLLYYYQ